MVVVVGIFIIFPTKTTWIHNSQTHFCSFAFPFVGWSEIYRGIKIRVTFLCEPSPKSVTNRQSLPPHWWRGWIIQSSLTNWIILSSLVLSSKLSSFSSRVSWSGAKARHKPIVHATRGGSPYLPWNWCHCGFSTQRWNSGEENYLKKRSIPPTTQPATGCPKKMY